MKSARKRQERREWETINVAKMMQMEGYFQTITNKPVEWIEIV